jgi:hypothetical protein
MCSEIDGLYCQMGEDGEQDHADEHLSITPVEKG